MLLYTKLMSLENIFYVMSIFYMTLGIIILLALVIAVFYIKKKIEEFEKIFQEKMDIISNIASHPGETAMGIGASLAEVAVNKIKNAFEGKGKKKS